MMNKILIFLIMIMTISGFVFATADGPDSYKVINVADNDTLNLRATPSVKAKILAKIPPHATGLENLVILAEKNGTVIGANASDVPLPGHEPYWVKIKYKNYSGWVQLRFLSGDM